MNADLLGTPVKSTAEALALFGARAHAFEGSYVEALDRILERSLPTCVCTIYDGNLGREEASIARTALCIFNDVILRAAAMRRVRVLDLRLICSAPEHYANPIEPSALGGERIAQAIARWVLEDPSDRSSRCVIST